MLGPSQYLSMDNTFSSVDMHVDASQPCIAAVINLYSHPT
jgi:hypothetical protein